MAAESSRLKMKVFNEASAVNTMRSAWDLVRDFTFRSIGKKQKKGIEEEKYQALAGSSSERRSVQ